jgi:hypothetical protein
VIEDLHLDAIRQARFASGSEFLNGGWCGPHEGDRCRRR